MAYDNPYRTIWEESPEQFAGRQQAHEGAGVGGQVAFMDRYGYGPPSLAEEPEGLRALADKREKETTDQLAIDRETEKLAEGRQHELNLQGAADTSTRAGLSALGIDAPPDLGGQGLELFSAEKRLQAKETRAAQAPPSAYQQASMDASARVEEKARLAAGTKAGQAAYKSALQGVPSSKVVSKDQASYDAAVQAYNESGGEAQIVGVLDPTHPATVRFHNTGGPGPAVTNASQAAAADALPMTPEVEGQMPQYQPGSTQQALTPEAMAAATRSGTMFPPEEGEAENPYGPANRMTDPLLYLLDKLQGR